jgi:release factor glutamine methyltransferase
MDIRLVKKQYTDIEVDLLLSYILKKPKEFLYMHPKTKLTPIQSELLVKLAKRRRDGEPIAYIVGYKYFYGLKFKVNKHVLTPRPETEWLVERALARVQGLSSKKPEKSKISVLDMGTGSGCIAISLAHSLATHHSPPAGRLKATITASDVSAAALKVAAQNAKKYKTNVEFIQSDLFSNIPGKFNIIAANLPYVPQGMYELLYHHLRYEPKVAITDGTEVWDMYKRFFTQLPKHIAASGVVLMEIDDGSKPALTKMLKKALPGWTARFYKDLGGHWRYLEMTNAR